MNSIKIGKLDLPIITESINQKIEDDRVAELPLAKWFLEKPMTLELGCVTPYYWQGTHQVFDQFDPHPRATATDIRAMNFSGWPILSISTIEHISFGDYHLKVPGEAFETLVRIRRQSPQYLTTWPYAWNTELDAELFASGIPFVGLERIGENEWRQGYNPKATYDSIFPCANQIIIVTNQEELLTP